MSLNSVNSDPSLTPEVAQGLMAIMSRATEAAGVQHTTDIIAEQTWALILEPDEEKPTLN